MPARYLVASLLVFVVCAGFGVLFHGVLLEDRYVENAELLRGSEELFPRLGYMIAGYLVQALLFCHVFTKCYEARGLAEGARFGLLMGFLIFLPTHLVLYALQPFPGRLVGLWVLGGLVQAVLSGMIAAGVYRAGRSRRTVR